MDGIAKVDSEVEGQYLTTWSVLPGGDRVSLGFSSPNNEPIRVVLPVAALTGLLMTLPDILQTALDRQVPGGGLRVVYPLGTWQIEQADAHRGVILRLATPDGFGVAFTIAGNDADGLGVALLRAPLAMDTTPTRELH